MLFMPPFLLHHSPPLLSVPYPPNPCHNCCPLARVCISLYSASTSILVKYLAFSPFPRYLSYCLAHPPPSYLRHPSISSSLRFSPTPQYFIPTPSPTHPSLSHSYIFIYIYLSPLDHFLFPLSLTHYLSRYISLQRLILPASYSRSHSI